MKNCAGVAPIKLILLSAPVKSCVQSTSFVAAFLPRSKHYSLVASLEAACETVACLWLRQLNALTTVQQMTDGRKLQLSHLLLEELSILREL